MPGLRSYIKLEEIMKVKDMPKVELEVLSYTDLTYMILKENKKTMNTPTIFRTICDLLGYTDEDYTNKIGDYYTSVALDKRFVLLDSAEWDLREHRSVELSYEDDEEEVDIDEEEDVEEATEEEIEDVDAVNEDDDLEDDDDGISLTIVDEDELEEEEM